jgi:hypothetical protein
LQEKIKLVIDLGRKKGKGDQSFRRPDSLLAERGGTQPTRKGRGERVISDPVGFASLTTVVHGPMPIEMVARGEDVLSRLLHLLEASQHCSCNSEASFLNFRGLFCKL